MLTINFKQGMPTGSYTLAFWKRLYLVISKIFFLTFFLLPSLVHATFLSPSNFLVTPKGSASYILPIQVPPGTADIEPRISLGYDSQGGNGTVGLGWSVGGLSQLTRCSKTIAQDGARAGVTYENTDKFCLDGQRLIAISGTYGANGAEYRTEISNFAKIISYGTAGTGPSYFKVWTKSGQVLEYGNTADSKIEAAGLATVRLWALNKLTDLNGNYLTATYVEDNPNGEAYISRFDYTGNASSSPVLSTFASVQFVYETRADNVAIYQAGAVIKNTKRLTNIKTYVGSNVIRNYKVTYSNTGNYHTNLSNQSDGSLVTSIQECDGATTPLCLPANTFSWSNNKGTLSAPIGSGVPAGAGAYQDNDFTIGDVNGDGKADVLFFKNPTGCSVLTFNGSLSEQPNWAQSHPCMRFFYSLADLNGDGKQDVLANSSVYISGTYQYPVQGNYLSDGTKFNSIEYPIIPGPYLSQVPDYYGQSELYQYLFTDFNGDGLLDYVARVSEHEEGGNRFAISLFNGATFSANTTWALESNDILYHSRAFFPDINGDGLSDLVFQNTSSQFWVYLSTGTAFQPKQNWINFGINPLNTRTNFADVNGDGLPDMIFNSGNNQYQVALSTGKGFTAASVWSTQSSSTTYTNTFFVDVNGDGRADLVHQNPSSQFYVGLSAGSGFAPVVNWVNQVGDARYTRANFGDVNGDGIADLVFQRNDNSLWVSLATSQADRLTSITDGLGKVTSLIYKPLTDSTVYAKDSGSLAASYPRQDTQSAKYVVASSSVSDGIGGTVATNYLYGGDKVDLNGRGSLGFRWVKSVSPDTGISNTYFYRQDFPFIGQVLQVEERSSNGTLLSVASNLYSNVLLGSAGAQSNFPYTTRNIQKYYELNGSFVKSNYTDYQYDSYGNQTQAVTTDSDGTVKTTTNQYTNDITNWILGRLVRTNVGINTPDSGATNPYPTSVFSITALSADKAEGLNAQITAFTFTVARSDTAGTGSVNWAVTGSGTNQANGADFQGGALPTGGVSFNEGEASKTLTIFVQGDASVETDEQFTVTLSSPGGVGGAANPVLGTATGIGIIRNDDIASYVFNPVITADVLNYNLKAAAIAAGWNQTTPLNATVTVNNGIYIGSASTANPAFDTGTGFPNGSVLQVINNGFIVGAGGKGGEGAGYTTAATSGGAGGPAIRVQFALYITNNGIVGGGNGGNGGNIFYVKEEYDPLNEFSYRDYYNGCSGSGGNGFNIGVAGVDRSCYPWGASGVGVNGIKPVASTVLGLSGSVGSNDSGDYTTSGSPGAGGAGGAATLGNSYINWLQVGTRYGSLN